MQSYLVMFALIRPKVLAVWRRPRDQGLYGLEIQDFCTVRVALVTPHTVGQVLPCLPEAIIYMQKAV